MQRSARPVTVRTTTAILYIERSRVRSSLLCTGCAPLHALCVHPPVVVCGCLFVCLLGGFHALGVLDVLGVHPPVHWMCSLPCAGCARCAACACSCALAVMCWLTAQLSHAVGVHPPVHWLCCLVYIADATYCIVLDSSISSVPSTSLQVG